FLPIRRDPPPLRAFAPKAVICVTVKPRFSAPTTDRAFAATALTSATTTFFSSNLSAIEVSLEEASHKVSAPPHRPTLWSTPPYSRCDLHQDFLIRVPPSAQALQLRALKARLRSSMMVAFGIDAARSPPSIQN